MSKWSYAAFVAILPLGVLDIKPSCNKYGSYTSSIVFGSSPIVYNRYLPWPEGKKPHPILYALTANLLSFGIGLELNTHCTNTHIRLIALVCLVLWYAGPWLCRKLQKVQNAQ